MSRDGIFPLVLGGDCSILIGIMAALKSKGTYGLIFCDAHADFYLPEQSITGEAADMDLALVTGRGPDSLTNLGDLRPYVKDAHVFHIGQRDAEEAKRYGSQAIQDTAIHCFDWQLFRNNNPERLIDMIVNKANALKLDGYWLHFDTDVLSDDENPAVDYRLPGGFSFSECEHLLKKIVALVPVAGMSVTIFNPSLDPDGRIASRLVQCMEYIFSNE
jgi:arginase